MSLHVSCPMRFLALAAAVGLGGCASGEPSLKSLDTYSAAPPRVVDVTDPGAGYRTQVVYLDTRPHVTQSFLLLLPERPVASAIMFVGGNGRIKLRENGWVRSSNFLVRSRTYFVRRRIAVAIVDVPSDIPSLKDLMTRLGVRHQKDMEAVINYLKVTIKRPVWLVGTSRGTVSAAAVAVKSRVPVDGLVLTSSMREVTELDLGKVRVPAMVVANRNDTCRVTPPGYARTIARALRTRAVYFESPGTANRPCGALSPHGFLGIEEKVAAAIAKFMRRR